MRMGLLSLLFSAAFALLRAVPGPCVVSALEIFVDEQMKIHRVVSCGSPAWPVVNPESPSEIWEKGEHLLRWKK